MVYRQNGGVSMKRSIITIALIGAMISSSEAAQRKPNVRVIGKPMHVGIATNVRQQPARPAAKQKPTPAVIYLKTLNEMRECCGSVMKAPLSQDSLPQLSNDQLAIEQLFEAERVRRGFAQPKVEPVSPQTRRGNAVAIPAPQPVVVVPVTAEDVKFCQDMAKLFKDVEKQLDAKDPKTKAAKYPQPGLKAAVYAQLLYVAFAQESKAAELRGKLVAAKTAPARKTFIDQEIIAARAIKLLAIRALNAKPLALLQETLKTAKGKYKADAQAGIIKLNDQLAGLEVYKAPVVVEVVESNQGGFSIGHAFAAIATIIGVAAAVDYFGPHLFLNKPEGQN